MHGQPGSLVRNPTDTQRIGTLAVPASGVALGKEASHVCLRSLPILGWEERGLRPFLPQTTRVFNP